MKVAVSSAGTDLSAAVDPRFGRALYFLIVETGDMGFEVFSNQGAASSGGAGIQTAQAVSGFGVEAVITGSVGPNAFRTLGAAGLRIFVGAGGTVEDAVRAFMNGELQEASAPTSGSHAGMGGGMRGGMGGGAGRGMGGGAVAGRDGGAGRGRKAGGD